MNKGADENIIYDHFVDYVADGYEDDEEGLFTENLLKTLNVTDTRYIFLMRATITGGSDNEKVMLAKIFEALGIDFERMCDL